ncbi:hypothetical protein Vi05172_g6195 [Venturia inaequalis]|nr:hypothetical protein Vi05172_g6195 [Venturia inaequalis]
MMPDLDDSQLRTQRVAQRTATSDSDFADGTAQTRKRHSAQKMAQRAAVRQRSWSGLLSRVVPKGEQEKPWA